MENTSNHPLDDANINFRKHEECNEATIFIISDSLGDTASATIQAAMTQFKGERYDVRRLSKVSSVEQVHTFLSQNVDDKPKVVFVTIADGTLSLLVMSYVAGLGLNVVDLLGPAVAAISRATGKNPENIAGANRKLDDVYFKRIEAMDFAVDHDDGRLPEDYKDADIVLVGVSRTSKTPLSMYLATQGYKVANLPLAPGMTPPKQIFDVPAWRIFGLMSNTSVLQGIRQRRLGPDGMKVAQEYASEDYIERDLEEARALMRKLGCIVVHTDNRAIEETAQEILSYYERALRAQQKQHI